MGMRYRKRGKDDSKIPSLRKRYKCVFIGGRKKMCLRLEPKNIPFHQETMPFLNACQIQLSMTMSWNHMGILRYHRYLKGYSLNILQSLLPRDQMGVCGSIFSISLEKENIIMIQLYGEELVHSFTIKAKWTTADIFSRLEIPEAVYSSQGPHFLLPAVTSTLSHGFSPSNSLS